MSKPDYHSSEFTPASHREIADDFAAGKTKPEVLTAAGAISVAKKTTVLAVTGGSDVAFTLADGVEGQEKVISLRSKGGAGNAVVTPAHMTGGTTITLNSANDLIKLIFIGTVWVVLTNAGCVVA